MLETSAPEECLRPERGSNSTRCTAARRLRAQINRYFAAWWMSANTSDATCHSVVGSNRRTEYNDKSRLSFCLVHKSARHGRVGVSDHGPQAKHRPGCDPFLPWAGNHCNRAGYDSGKQGLFGCSELSGPAGNPAIFSKQSLYR